MVEHLAPMYFRIGGTYADRIVFTETDEVGLRESDMTFFGEFKGFKFLWGFHDGVFSFRLFESVPVYSERWG